MDVYLYEDSSKMGYYSLGAVDKRFWRCWVQVFGENHALQSVVEQLKQQLDEEIESRSEIQRLLSKVRLMRCNDQQSTGIA